MNNQDYFLSIDELRAQGSASPVGRSTRRFTAYSVERDELVFLKDLWRPISKRHQAEHLIYEKLHETQVENIAVCFGGEDVPEEGLTESHSTITQDYVDCEWNKGEKKSLRRLRHYRIVLEKLTRRLLDFLTLRELVTVVRDAARGE